MAKIIYKIEIKPKDVFEIKLLRRHFRDYLKAFGIKKGIDLKIEMIA